MKRSGLRGRGGAGFPAGVKWGFMPKDPQIPKIVAVNTDEGEPGTFKDRQIVECDPHPIIEGVLITSYAVGANRAYVYIRGEFFLGVKRWIKAIADAYEQGFLGKNIFGSGFDLDMSVHRGAGAYICGEETAMIESLEGKPGNPRMKPPYPAQVGLFGAPTLVHNIETLACIRHIVQRRRVVCRHRDGGEQRPQDLFGERACQRPGKLRAAAWAPLERDHLRACRRDAGRQEIKGCYPRRGVHTHADRRPGGFPMAFETLEKAGSQLGTGAIVVMNEDTCMVEAARRISKFFAHESCGRCTPCRVGSVRLYEALDRIEHGKGLPDDIERALYLSENIDGRTFCPMGAALVNPARSTIQKFREEYEYHIQNKRCWVVTNQGSLYVSATDSCLEGVFHGKNSRRR